MTLEIEIVQWIMIGVAYRVSSSVNGSLIKLDKRQKIVSRDTQDLKKEGHLGLEV